MDIIPLKKWIPNFRHPLIIAGPCSAESEEQVLKTAKEIDKIESINVFRAGIWKPRTRPSNFEGQGQNALPWLKRVKKETRLLVTTEVANAKHVDLALKNDIDILWIGARTSASPFAVQEIANALKGSNIPVMIKNPISADLALWIGSIERIFRSGINKIAAIHRGFASYDSSIYRNSPIWRIPIELKHRFPELPVICDPSHISGDKKFIQEISQRALDIDMDGLMIECHNEPEKAWSDAKQQMTPEELKKLLNENLTFRIAYSLNRIFEHDLEELRNQIDRIDKELIDCLHLRTKVVENIGTLKATNNVTALQLSRMDSLIKKRIEMGKALNLNENYVNEIFNVIHAESVKIQTEIMNSFKKDPQTKKNEAEKF